VLAASLDAWLQQLKRTEERSAVARREWADLQALLAGRPLPDVEGHVAELRRRADDLRQQVDPTQLAAWRWDGAPDDVVAALGREAARLDAEVAGLEGSLRARTGGVPSVAEAVEEVAAARAELERVTTLRDDLATAESFLRQAEQRANRDLAPRLAGAVRDRLGPVTAGRYTDVRVDPATMEVTVLDPDGRWRAARDLSHGTAEQIYLLLRVALAELLVQPGASCPLLLDDVLVQSDPTRSRAVLDLLLRVSSDHQVILFSQEDDVQRWARTHLAGQSRHRHVELPPAPTGRPPRSGSVADPEAAAVTPFP
jgi:DNA repair exonuclease SbcCD ATPase subunit